MSASGKKGRTDTGVVSKGCLQCGVQAGAAADPGVIAGYGVVCMYNDTSISYIYSPPFWFLRQ